MPSPLLPASFLTDAVPSSQGILELVKLGEISGTSVAQSFIAIARVAEERMGGTSGALYAIYFASLSQSLRSSQSAASVTWKDWSTALGAALTRLYHYTRARPPSRTLIDPLAAFTEAFLVREANFKAAVEAAVEAAEKTKDLDAMAGRSAYVEGDRLKAENVADPGAWGVKVRMAYLRYHVC